MTNFCKIIVLGCIISFTFFSSISFVNAASFDNVGVYLADVSDGVCGSGNSECQAVFGSPKDIDCPAYWMQWTLNVMKYVAIAALLVLSTLDFVKALASNDKDALKKAGVTAGKRFIFVAILFFLPILINFIMSWFGAYGTCGIG